VSDFVCLVLSLILLLLLKFYYFYSISIILFMVAGAGCDELALQSQLDHALEIIAIKNESALAEALIAQGDIRSAINCYQKLLASVKKSDPAPFVKAKEAAAAFLQASETNPKDDSTHLPTNSKLETALAKRVD
jgi:DNA polymerase III delta prime subunit